MIRRGCLYGLPWVGMGGGFTFLADSACVLLSRMRLIPVFFPHVLLCLSVVLTQGCCGSMWQRTAWYLLSVLCARSRPHHDLIHETLCEVQSVQMVLLVQIASSGYLQQKWGASSATIFLAMCSTIC